VVKLMPFSFSVLKVISPPVGVYDPFAEDARRVTYISYVFGTLSTQPYTISSSLVGY
jgi:hypothetical protein